VHGNGKDWDHMGPMGFSWEWEYDQPWDGNGIEVCGKWELRRGNGKKSVHTVTRKHLQQALIAFKFISYAIIVQQYYLVVFLCKLRFNFLGALNSFNCYIICFL